MESAIVQACRCAEAILGEPPNTSNKSRVITHKKKWGDAVGLDPDEIFDRTKTSYWEFYLKLFKDLRNPSAHSYGNIHFELERKHTIDSQCFAALIIRGYVEQNKKSIDKSLRILKFNEKLLNQVGLNISTSLTKNTK